MNETKGDGLMRMVVTTLLAPVFVVAVGLLMANYSSPSELWASLRPIKSDIRPADGASNVEEAVRDVAKQLPQVDLATGSEDCFRDLAVADKAKLDRCAGVVYQVLADVERHKNEPAVQQALREPDRERLIMQLQLAAAEVCRVKWVRTNGAFSFDSPACEASNLRLVSDR